VTIDSELSTSKQLHVGRKSPFNHICI